MTLVLKDNGIMAALSRTVDRATDSMKLNEVAKHKRWGRIGMMKRRNAISWATTRLANFYFWMSGVPIRFLGGRAWQRWESGCFRLVNEGFEASAIGEDRVWADKVPGKSLFEHMKQGTLRRKMLEAAGREFRRCHERWIADFDGGWSHGDATMSNVIYDGRRNRARFIDFEIMHVSNMPEVERQADDLLVFLLDLIGFVPEKRWVPLAMAFLDSYGDEGVIRALAGKLTPWRGLARIWWRVRTNFIDSKKLERRLQMLREALRQREAPMRGAAA